MAGITGGNDAGAGPGRLHADLALVANDNGRAFLGQEVSRRQSDDAAAHNDEIAVWLHAVFILVGYVKRTSACRNLRRGTFHSPYNEGCTKEHCRGDHHAWIQTLDEARSAKVPEGGLPRRAGSRFFLDA